MIKKLFSHSFIYGLAPQVTRIASVLSLPIITQHLNSTDFGIYGLITAVAGSVAVLNTLGLRVILTNSFYKSPHQYKWLWRQIYGFLFLWNIPYTIVLGFILWWFIPIEAVGQRWEIIGLNVLPIVFFGPTSIIGTTIYQLKQMPTQIAMRSAVFGILTVILNVYFIAVLKMGFMGWFISTCISTMLNQASYFIPLSFSLGIKPIFNFKWRLMHQSLKISLPTVPHYYAAYLLDSSDRIIMTTSGVNTSNIGLYNAAYTVGNLFKQLGTATGYAIGPLMNKAYRDNEHIKARNLVFILQISFFVLTFISSIWLKEVFALLLRNESLSSTYPLGIIILMAYNYRPMYFGANNKLFFEEKTKNLLKVTFVAAVLNISLNIILIPVLGYKVAAYVTFISLMYMGYAGFYLKVFKEINKVEYYPKVWLFITILLSFIAYFIVELNVFYKIPISFISILFGVIAIRKISGNT